MAKVRLTAVFDLELHKTNYESALNADGEDLHLSDEDMKALTDEQMLEFERRFLRYGEVGLEEIIDADSDDIKLELVKED